MLLDICTTFLYFTMDNVSLSFKENSENETNVERISNNLKWLDVASVRPSFSDFMPCNIGNQTFLKTKY